MYTCMEIAIQRINDIVQTTLKETEHKQTNVQQLKETLNHAKASFKTYLLNRSQLVNSERELEIIVHQCQSEIINLMDQIHEVQLANNSRQPHEAMNVLLEDLKESLTYIENRFSRFFNLNEKVPDYYYQLTRADLQKLLKQIKLKLNSITDVEGLVGVIETPIIKLHTQKTLTYKDLMYLKKVYRDIADICKKFNEASMMQHVNDYLLYVNFNSYSFVTYTINRISVEVNSVHDAEERIELLSYHLKRINQVHLKPDAALKAKVVSVKEQVATWISEELYFIEKKQRLFTVIPNLKDEPVITDEEKLHLSVSVDVLTLLARAAKDSKLIMNQQMTSMYKSISKFCRTVNTDNPSAHSMLKKGYVAERNSTQTAINLLHEMIKHLHKY